MATLDELVSQGMLEDWTNDIAQNLPRGWLPLRRLFVSPSFSKWAADVLPTLVAIYDPELSIEEQFEGALEDYVVGRPVPYPTRIKPWRRVDDCVWYLKTNDLRIFGWFVDIDTFIATHGVRAEEAKCYNLYNGFVGQVVRFRNLLDLDEPKTKTGKEVNDVLSI